MLVGELLDKKGQVLQTFSTYIGFRQGGLYNVAAADDEFGRAGRYFLLNGKPVKMKGVNRHETSRNNGHYGRDGDEGDRNGILPVVSRLAEKWIDAIVARFRRGTP